MSLNVQHSLLLVRDLSGSGGPDCPSGWRCFSHDNNWYELVDASGHRILAYRENDNGTQGLFALFGDTDTLASIDSTSALAQPARWCWRHRNDVGVKPYVRRWRTLRGTGQERIDGSPVAWSGVRTVIPSGVALPDWDTDPLPWNFAADGSLTTAALAVIRLETVSGVDTLALDTEMAATALPSQFANEPDPGT